jgi:hypothetical protein
MFELLMPTLAAPWLGSLVGLTFAVSILAVLATLSFHAGLYYSVPRLVLKQLGSRAMGKL